MTWLLRQNCCKMGLSAVSDTMLSLIAETTIAWTMWMSVQYWLLKGTSMIICFPAELEEMLPNVLNETLVSPSSLSCIFSRELCADVWRIGIGCLHYFCGTVEPRCKTHWCKKQLGIRDKCAYTKIGVDKIMHTHALLMSMHYLIKRLLISPQFLSLVKEFNCIHANYAWMMCEPNGVVTLLTSVRA